MYYNSDRLDLYVGILSEIRIKNITLSNTYFISGLLGASNESALRMREINVVVSIIDEDDMLSHFEGITYHRFNLPDGDGDIVGVAQDAAKIFDALQGQRVLIHCAVGASRSVCVLIYYLMLKLDIPYSTARRYIKNCRPIASPVEHYRNQLLAWRASRSQDINKEVLK